MRYLALLSLVVVASASPAAAQRTSNGGSSIAAGTRVRATTAGQRVTGTVVAASPDSIVVRQRGQATTSFANADVTRLEVSRGVETHKLRYGTIGLLAGAALGLALGIQAGNDEVPNDEFGLARASLGLSGIVVGGALGAVAGVIVGSRGNERWETIREVSRTGSPRSWKPAGARLGVALRF